MSLMIFSFEAALRNWPSDLVVSNYEGLGNNQGPGEGWKKRGPYDVFPLETESRHDRIRDLLDTYLFGFTNYIHRVGEVAGEVIHEVDRPERMMGSTSLYSRSIQMNIFARS
jgi:hypothetical protein